MIGFNTTLPLSIETDVKDFMNHCRNWMKNNNNTSLVIDDSEIKDELKYLSTNETLEFMIFENNDSIHCGVRHTKKDSDCEWRTDIVGFKNLEEFTVSIVTTKADFNISTYSKLPLRPYIIKILTENTNPMYDDGIQIVQHPKEVTQENYNELALIINNKKVNQFPVVYISKKLDGKYLINPKNLATKLSGFAHVYYQLDEEVSRKLKEETDGNNSYNGTIGIYWPGGSRNYYYSQEEVDHSLKLKFFIQKTLNNRTLKKECKWSYVQDLKSKSKINEYRKNNSELNEFMEAIFSEIEVLKERVEQLENENLYLTSQIDSLSENEFSNNTKMIYKGSERELFKNEQIDFILNLLDEKLSKSNSSNRIKGMIESILASNERSESKQEFLKIMKKILESDKGINKQSKKELRSLGFEVTEEGKHYKLKFQGNSNYSFTVPKSHSDHRGPKNNYSDFKDYFFSN